MFNFYGIFIALGILVGSLVVDRARKILNTKYCILNIDIFDILPWVLIPGIIGARLYHVFDYWDYYRKDLWEILMVWQGGLGIFGGILGGTIGIWIFLKLKTKNKKPKTSFDPELKTEGQTKNAKIGNIFLSYLDLGVIGLSIGQAIGRWGNYFNQELYGWPTNLSWGIYIRPENRLLGFEEFERFHPLFLYESLGCLVIFVLLLVVAHFSARLRSRNKFRYYKEHGSIFFLYLFLYSFLRFWLEYLRIESWEMGGVRATQILSSGLMLISARFLLKQFLHPVIGRA